MDAALYIPERHQAGDITERIRDQLHGHLGDNSESSLRSDHQMQQAVAGAGLADRFAEFNNPPVCQDDRESQDIVPGNPVLHRAHAAGVGGDVAAHSGGFLAGIRWIHEAVGQCVCRQVLQQDTRLNPDNQVVHVVFQDPVHAPGAEYHTACQRNTASHQTGSRSPAGNGNAVG